MLDRYVLVPAESRFTVQAFASGLLSVFAHSPIIAIRDFTSELQFTSGTFDNASFQMTVKAASLTPTDSVREQDRPEIEERMHREVLETATYPEIRYRSNEVAATRITEGWYRVRFRGELALHGVTRPQEADAQVRLADDEVRLSGEFTLLHSTYGLKRVTALAGMITVKDELKFSFDLVGRKESP